MWVPNVFDPYAMGLYCEIKMKLENLNLVEYLPCEITLLQILCGVRWRSWSN